MTNYDMDEIERQRERERKSRGIRSEDETHSVELELDHKDLLKLALVAHDKNITLNQMCIDILKQEMENSEHDSRPQLLNEIGEPFKS